MQQFFLYLNPSLLWKFQFSFKWFLSFKSFGFWNPHPVKSSLQWSSKGWVWIFSVTTQLFQISYCIVVWNLKFGIPLSRVIYNVKRKYNEDLFEKFANYKLVPHHIQILICRHLEWHILGISFSKAWKCSASVVIIRTRKCYSSLPL